jgi:hypothetical protein
MNRARAATNSSHSSASPRPSGRRSAPQTRLNGSTRTFGASILRHLIWPLATRLQKRTSAASSLGSEPCWRKIATVFSQHTAVAA